MAKILILISVSSNGTFLNGQLIGKGKMVTLMDGDTVSLGAKAKVVAIPETLQFIGNGGGEENFIA